MEQLFECRIRHGITAENGQEKKVTDLYLVDAMSFTEAEARVIKEVTPYYADLEVAGIKKARYDDVVFADEAEADTWYAVTMDFISLNERTGKEEKKKAYYLLQAESLTNAMKRLSTFMKGTMADYSTVCVKETTIEEVYTCKEKKANLNFS